MITLQKTIKYQGDIVQSPISKIQLAFFFPVFDYILSGESDVGRATLSKERLEIDHDLHQEEYRISAATSNITGKKNETIRNFLIYTTKALTDKNIADLSLNIPVHVSANSAIIGDSTLQALYIIRNIRRLQDAVGMFPRAIRQEPSEAVIFLEKNLYLINKITYEKILPVFRNLAHRDDDWTLLSIVTQFLGEADLDPAVPIEWNDENQTLLERLLDEEEIENQGEVVEFITKFFTPLFDFPVNVPEIQKLATAGTFAVKTPENAPLTKEDLAHYDLSIEYTYRDANDHLTAGIIDYDWDASPEAVADNTIHFDFPGLDRIIMGSVKGLVSVRVKAFDGTLLWAKAYQPDDPALKEVVIVVSQLVPIVLQPGEPKDLVDTQKKLRGQVLELSKKCKLKDAMVIVQARKEQDERWHVVAAGTTDASGNFSMLYPYGKYAGARAIVSLTPDSPADIPIVDTGKETETISGDFLFLLIEKPDCDCSELIPGQEKDCGAPKKAGRLPDQEDLLNSDEYSQDIGGSCVNLTTPNRTLSEFNYQGVVRTSDPDVANYTLKKNVVPEPENDFQIMLDAKFGSPVRTWFELEGGAETITRKPVSLTNPIKWQDSPDSSDDLSLYQAVTIATGHILHYKAVTKADGYSLGNLLYSLALAPGQKKQIVMFDSSHSLHAAETQEITQADNLSADIVADRGIDNLLGGGLNELMQGSSSANTSGVSAGLGIGANIGVIGGALGVSGGTSNASSSANQNSSRNVSQYFNERLRQSVMQRASDIRQINAAVVTSVQEGQKYTGTTEVVANHNHCHALTMLYFEVLRHYAIYQELASVEECIFVPLLMTNFTVENISKWNDVLASHLLPIPSNTYLQQFRNDRRHPLLTGFDANERIKTKYAYVDFPKGRYCDEVINSVSGKMTIRADIPRPKTRFDRIKSLPVIRTTVTTQTGVDVGGTIRENIKDSVVGALTGGLSLLFGGGPSVKYNTETHEVLTKGKIFDLFMTLDENYEKVPPSQCIRVHNFRPIEYFDGTRPGHFDFFQSEPDDKKIWEAYAAVLGMDVYELLDKFANNVISDWDRIFFDDIAPQIIKALIHESTLIPDPISNLDITSNNHYSGREQLLSYNFTASTTKTRADIKEVIFIYNPILSLSLPDRQTLIDKLILNVENITINYSTAHYSGRIFSGYVGNDLLENVFPMPVITIQTPMNSDEKRSPRDEDIYIVTKLIEHLNSNLEYYNKILWYRLDIDRRYMLLDGFGIQVFDGEGNPIPGTRSLASVIKNELTAVVGNSMVFPVAAGYRISKTYIVENPMQADAEPVTLFDHYKPLTPIPPYRISVPSKGVFVEAVQGACDACEREKEKSSQDWTKFTTDEPTPIATVVTPVPTISDWKAAWKEFAPPLINIQNAPAAPAPGAGLAGLSELLGKSGIFKDITGLDANQQNAIRTYLSNQENARAFAEMAKGMAMQEHNTQHSNQIMDTLKSAKDSGAVNQQEYGQLVKDHLQKQIDGGEAQNRQEERESKKQETSPIKSAVDIAQTGSKVTATETDAEGNIKTLDVGPNPDFQLVHDVSPGSSASTALAALTKEEFERRVNTSQTTVHSFTPKAETSLVLWAKEFTPPEGITVRNWTHSGVKKYTVNHKGNPLTPVRRPDEIWQVILHETAGWANIGAGAPWTVHLTVGPDGIVYQHCDLSLFTEHGNQMNPSSIGIEFTNYSTFGLAQNPRPPLTPSGRPSPITDLQGGAVGGSVVEDRQRIPISWLSGNPGDGIKGDYYVVPPVEQLTVLAKLVKWLTDGVLAGAAIDAPQLWRQLIDHPTDPARKLFAMSFHPKVENALHSGGILPHILFQKNHFDGSAPGLYTWLVINRGFDEQAAYTKFIELISSPQSYVMVPVKVGSQTTKVHCLDVSSIADRNL